jgi:hypothetical protein
LLRTSPETRYAPGTALLGENHIDVDVVERIGIDFFGLEGLFKHSFLRKRSIRAGDGEVYGKGGEKNR